MSAVVPAAAARRADRLFMTPPRHEPPAAEREALLETRRESVRVDSGRVRVWIWGHGPAVLLVHGWGGRGGQLRAFVPPLLAAGLRAIAFDAPGHGASDGRRSSLPAMADAALAVAGAFGPVVGVVAHSAGSAATTVALSRGLRLDAAVFVSPPLDLARHSIRFAEVYGFSESVRAEMQRRIELRIGVRWADLHMLELAPRMTTPLLVIHDAADVEVPWDEGATIAGAWPGAELSTTRGLGHRRILRDSAVIGQGVAFLRDRLPLDLAVAS
jgi:pimeloyl-ACP methyl ester carboxylesterase